MRAVLRRERTYGAQDLRTKPPLLVLRRHQGGQGRERRRLVTATISFHRPLHNLIDRGRQVLGGAVPDEGDGVPERDDRAGGIAQQGLKVGEGVEKQAPVTRICVEHERRPSLLSQAIYLLFEARFLRQGYYFERHYGLNCPSRIRLRGLG